jgi:anti-sigma factor RsiW
MGGHVEDELAAYAETQLDPVSHARVTRHLETCRDCRDELARVRDGLALASRLAAEGMPPDLAERIRGQIVSGAIVAPASRASLGVARWWRAVAAAAIAFAAVALYWQLNRPWVQLHAATAAPTRFEAEGRELHDRIASGASALTLRSTDERVLWQWLDAQGAPVTSMRVSRPEDERARFVPLGAAVETIGGVKTSVLSYRIDGRSVTLALALSRDVPDAPAAGWWTKRVTHRPDANGTNTLTWTVGGGTYVMVSELDGAGQRACLICHTAPAFRERIRDLRA